MTSVPSSSVAKPVSPAIPVQFSAQEFATLMLSNPRQHPLDIKEESILGEAIARHWYYVAKGRALRRYLASITADEALDVGAGSGIFSRQLLDAGICRKAVCVDPNYPWEREEIHGGKPISFVRAAPPGLRMLALMMDVLEHVDDDVALLKQYAAPMPAGSHILITVPAFQFLWSGHDVFLEHRRRYTAATLEQTVRNAGLEVVRMHYFFGLLLPVVALLRYARNLLFKSGALAARSELKPAPRWLNALLIAAHDLERHTLFPFNKIAGLTIFCLCRKPTS